MNSMHMFKKYVVLVVLVVAAVLAGFWASQSISEDAAAKGAAAKGSTIQLQPGVKVTLTGKNSGTMSKVGSEITGTFECACSSGMGTCTYHQDGQNITCYKTENDSCSADCELRTKIIGGYRSKLIK